MVACLKHFRNFHPEPWGDDPLEFQMGWFNHQLYRFCWGYDDGFLAFDGVCRFPQNKGEIYALCWKDVQILGITTRVGKYL